MVCPWRDDPPHVVPGIMQKEGFEEALADLLAVEPEEGEPEEIDEAASKSEEEF